MIQADGYFYNQQLRTYILQFMAIFSGLQVQVGKWNDLDERLISVPIHYAHQDRVVASILSDNTQNKPLRLPVMSAYMRSVQWNRDYAAGTGMQRNTTYTPTGGLVGVDTQTIHQRRASPYLLEMDLNLYASNSDQHFQMLEQFLPLFEPALTIAVSDGIFDMKRLSSVELTNISTDTNMPIGTDRRICQSTLTFRMPVWFETPAVVRKDFIEKIYLRIGAVSAGTNLNNSQEVIAELDGLGLEYALVQDATKLDID